MVTLYRRHLKNCKVHSLKIPAKAKRSYLACDCPLWIYGHTDDEDYPRQVLKNDDDRTVTDLAAAQAMVQALVNKGKAVAVHGPRIDDCITEFMESRKHKVGIRATESYTVMFKRLREYCTRKGVYFMRELTVDLLERFKVEAMPAGYADSSMRTAVSKLRCFLRVAFARDWIPKQLAEGVDPHHVAQEQKMPFTDEEVAKILAGAAQLNGGDANSYAGQPATFKLLLDLMLETGLRVSDAVRFDPAKLERGEAGLWIYVYQQTKKQKARTAKPSESYISDRLKVAIDACYWLSPTLPFWPKGVTDPYSTGQLVYKRLQAVGERFGIADCRPHRLRDTFAVRCLAKGIPIGDVSRLLGHGSVKTTELYYSPWVPARTRRLERLLAETIMNP